MTQSYAEKMRIRDIKIAKVLTFLGSGERWTTEGILIQLLGVSRTAVRRTVVKMLAEGSLKAEQIEAGSKKVTLLGITPHGLALADGVGSPFGIGRTKATQVAHHLATQKARIFAEQNGGSSWVPDKILRADKTLKKVPDATFITPAGKKVAVESERTIKTPARYEQDIANHLLQISAKSWHEVHYLLEPQLVPVINRVFSKIDIIKIKGEPIKLEQKHRDRFKFFSLSNWQF